jgi:diguanylate cyclase (GGDEF)-like protein
VKQSNTAALPDEADERSSAGEVGRTILVCADRSVLEAGQAALTEAGFHTARPEGWAEALSLFERLRPPAVLVDGAFLDGSGPRLCAALRRKSGPVEVPVLALCAGKREVRRAFEAGANDVVEKPLDWSVVSRRLLCLYRELKSSLQSVHLRQLLKEAHKSEFEAREKATRQTLVDSLTGLPSRLGLYQALQRHLARARSAEVGVALLTIDLDSFTNINETLGRAAGDGVLRQVGDRLSTALRTLRVGAGQAPGLMLAARVGGDEFAVQLTGSVDSERVVAFGRALLDEVARPLAAGGTEVHLEASLGIAIAQGDVTDPGELLQHAETAMYEAKRRGGGQLLAYSASLRCAADYKLGLDRRLRAALENEQLLLHYQPVIEPSTRRILGVEALLRWKDGDNGWLSPAEFVPVAEETGIMIPIGKWVLETACRQLRTWIDGGLPPIRMGVNVSRRQLERGDLAAEVERVLSETGLDPGLLELEISERGTLRSEPGIVAQLRKLRALGVRIVVDDFGTGQSAIAYLKQFPLDTLKIDRSFIVGAEDGGDDAAIVSAIVAMAHRLGLGIVAEGVETQGQLTSATGLGCEAIQGFFYSRALPPEDFAAAVEVDAQQTPSLKESLTGGSGVPS